MQQTAAAKPSGSAIIMTVITTKTIRKIIADMMWNISTKFPNIRTGSISMWILIVLKMPIQHLKMVKLIFCLPLLFGRAGDKLLLLITIWGQYMTIIVPKGDVTIAYNDYTALEGRKVGILSDSVDGENSANGQKNRI